MELVESLVYTSGTIRKEATLHNYSTFSIIILLIDLENGVVFLENHARSLTLLVRAHQDGEQGGRASGYRGYPGLWSVQ
jgi:hypothetical protein